MQCLGQPSWARVMHDATCRTILPAGHCNMPMITVMEDTLSIWDDLQSANTLKGSASCRTDLPKSLCYLARLMPSTAVNTGQAYARYCRQSPHAGHLSVGILQGTAMCRQTLRRPPSLARGTSWWPVAAMTAACASIAATQGSLSRCWRPMRMWPTACR